MGKMVCDMLDRLPVRYIALDSSPTKAIEARGKGLPVFYGTYYTLYGTEHTHSPQYSRSKSATQLPIYRLDIYPYSTGFTLLIVT